MRIHILGVCGTFMAGLAQILKESGHKVSGSDIQYYPPMSDYLEKIGIETTQGYQKDQLPKADLYVVGNALSRGNECIEEILDKKLPFVSGPEMLGKELKNRNVFAVSGTHGKTTTSSILTHIFSKTNQSFISVMGGFFNNDSSNLIQTGSESIIVEADEYDRSFLHLNPTIACITSVDADHLDIYESEDIFLEAFVQFSKKVSNELIVAYGLPISGLTYGIEVAADYKAFNLKITEKGYRFDLTTPNREFKDIFFNQMGIHNVSNALCALAMADQAGIDINKSLLALESFPGVYRRMNLYRWRDIVIIDDYAHHPSEIDSVFKTIKTFYPKQKNCVVFQPHLFSRTRDFMNDFKTTLSKFDEVILMDIYPAREKPIKGVNAKILV